MRAVTARWFYLGLISGSTGLALLVGCSKEQSPKPEAVPEKAAALSVQAKKESVPPASIPLTAFKDAVLFEPPEGEQRPPDQTAAGKNVAALFEAIAGQDGAPGLWDKIALTTPDGSPLHYAARLKTDLGTMEIELFPELAPNHVRNFIALAQAGYFNGLPFHRSLSGKAQGQTLAYLEAGCPLGTGALGFGSIGYWLKPEISANLTHEEGTVGAVHGEAVESAACKFYISLTRAAGMDGSYTVFGKIVKGLDIAHTINKRPVVDDDDSNDRPREPVVIREVTIQSSAAASAIVASDR